MGASGRWQSPDTALLIYAFGKIGQIIRIIRARQRLNDVEIREREGTVTTSYKSKVRLCCYKLSCLGDNLHGYETLLEDI